MELSGIAIRKLGELALEKSNLKRSTVIRITTTEKIDSDLMIDLKEERIHKLHKEFFDAMREQNLRVNAVDPDCPSWEEDIEEESTFRVWVEYQGGDQ